ncbi:MAG: SIS domain-containing protein [Anaerolineae bacterium]
MADQEEAVSLARRVLAQEIAALGELLEELGSAFEQVALVIAHCPGMVWVTGVGTSAAVAERFAHILNCCGRRSMFLHAADSLHGHAGVMAAGDVLVAMSRGGESAEVNSLAEIGNRLGVTTVAMVNQADSTLARQCHYVLPVPSRQEYELQGVIATTSTIVFSAMCDALAAVAWQVTGYTLEAFARTHPGGAVGKMLGSSLGHP